MSLYEYLITFTNPFWAYGKSKFDLVKMMFHLMKDYLVVKSLEGLKRRSEALHPLSAGKMNCNTIHYSVIMFLYEYINVVEIQRQIPISIHTYL